MRLYKVDKVTDFDLDLLVPGDILQFPELQSRAVDVNLHTCICWLNKTGKQARIAFMDKRGFYSLRLRG